MTTSVGPNPSLDVSGFIQSVFTVRLAPNVDGADSNGDFSTYAEILGYSALTDTGGSASVTNIIPDATIKKILTNQGNQSAVPDYFFSKGKCRDTSLGGNDAFNCYPQFNETDDVAEHPFLETIPNDKTGLSGMGRVYSEVYDDQQQIMYMTFGVPKFNDVTSFYSGAILTQLAQIMNNGGNVSTSTLGELIGEGIGTFISLPVLPLVWLYNALQGLSEVSITKYYDFKSAMPLYYRCVNSMIMHLSINLGLVQDDYFLTGGGNATTQSGILYDKSLMENAAEANNGDNVGLPDIFQKYGFDIYRILYKKYQYVNGQTNPELNNNNTTDYSLLKTTVDNSSPVNVSGPSGSPGTFFDNTFITPFLGTLYDASLYIGFRIEKGVDTSETFTNDTGQPSIAQTVNGKVQAARDAKFTVGVGGSGSDGIISSFFEGVGGILSGVTSSLGIGGLDQIMAGNGMLDFPDVWQNSSFSKDYSFSMSLRSPYGDPTSILQNLYYPLMLLLAGSLPRGVGQASYTSPFVCRVYCKGMFAIPLGMITSITIKRGADQFGWNTARLPTCIDVSFQIKDLSPAMYMGLADTGKISTALLDVFGTNSNFQEYLMTLSGMGLQERIVWLSQLRRNAQYLMAQTATTKLSKLYWGSAFGSSLPARAISVFVPATKIPRN